MIHNDNGIYIVFEGVDFCGKTTTITNVHQILQNTPGVDSLLTKHPGATPLGQHLRKLVKTPETIDININIDSVSAQVLMMIDQICFINTILTPELDNGKIVLADRSNFISAIAYGIPEGISITQLNKLFQFVNSPSPDRIFILRAPWEVLEERKIRRGGGPDRFEDNGNNYLQQVAAIYDNLKMRPDLLVLLSDYVSIENIVYLDATESPRAIAERVVAEILSIKKKSVS